MNLGHATEATCHFWVLTDMRSQWLYGANPAIVAGNHQDLRAVVILCIARQHACKEGLQADIHGSTAGFLGPGLYNYFRPALGTCKVCVTQRPSTQISTARVLPQPVLNFLKIPAPWPLAIVWSIALDPWKDP